MEHNSILENGLWLVSRSHTHPSLLWLTTQPIIFGSDSDLIFFLSDSRLNTDMIQNFLAITWYKLARYMPVFLSGRYQIWKQVCNISCLIQTCFYKSESGMITYLIQPVFRSDFKYRHVSSLFTDLYQVIATKFCIMSIFNLESDPNIIGCA